jgi:hypothetical protein
MDSYWAILARWLFARKIRLMLQPCWR